MSIYVNGYTYMQSYFHMRLA